MGFDSLRHSVDEYAANKSALEKDQQSFDFELEKLGDLNTAATKLDAEVVSAIDGINNEFSLEQAELGQRADTLRIDKDALFKKIDEEQTKLDAVQKKIDGLNGKKYTGGLDAVMRKCDALLSELDEMLQTIDADGGKGAGGTAVSDNSTAANSGVKDNGASSGQKGGLFSKLFSRNQAAPSGPKLGNFDLAPIQNTSDFFVKGTNYDQYIYDYYHSEQSTYENLGNDGIVATVSPGSIEGIHLGKTEAADSSVFWRQHQSDGTMASFVEIASHIPEVKSLLDAGLSLDEIRENPNLQQCADIYFEPSNIPRVIQSKGYYEFEANGRHRILAAREAGYDIPVRIVGIRRWK